MSLHSMIRTGRSTPVRAGAFCGRTIRHTCCALAWVVGGLGLSGLAGAESADAKEEVQVWNWAEDDFSSRAWPRAGRPSFGDGGWVVDAAYAAGQVSTSDAYVREPGSRSIRVYLDPTADVPDDAPHDGHYRAEIRRSHWHEPIPMGTEEWYGFSFYFPDSYVHDSAQRGVFFQLHAGSQGPPLSLDHYVPADWNGRYGSQLFFNRNWGAYNDRESNHREVLPFEFEGGQWYDFVVHVVWDTEDGGQGLTQLWVNGEKHYSATGGNTYDAGTDRNDTNLPYGGTLKMGFYKWSWRRASNVEASIEAGVEELEMYIGPVRTIRRAPGEHIGMDGYELVAPRPAEAPSTSGTP